MNGGLFQNEPEKIDVPAPTNHVQLYEKIQNVIAYFSEHPIQKDSVNDNAKKNGKAAKYAGPALVLNSVNKVLCENGLIVMPASFLFDKKRTFYRAQFRIIDTETGKFILYKVDAPMNAVRTTPKYNEITGDLLVPERVTGNPIQNFGATQTYLQRYAYGMMFGLGFDDEDPDAGKHTEQPRRAVPNYTQPQPQEQTPGLISDKQSKLLYAIWKGAGIVDSDMKSFIKTRYHIESTKDLKIAQFNELKSIIETNKFYDNFNR